MIGLSYYKYVTKLVKKIKLNTTSIRRMRVVFNIIFFTRFVTLTSSSSNSRSCISSSINICSFTLSLSKNSYSDGSDNSKNTFKDFKRVSQNFGSQLLLIYSNATPFKALQCFGALSLGPRSD